MPPNWGSASADRLFLILTLLLGGVFLGVKAYEWNEKFVEHHVPGPTLPSGEAIAASRASAQLFFSLYFAMTGLHALHMVIGVGICWRDRLAGRQGRFTADYTTRRWMWRDFTGTSSTSSGSSCSRCST